MHKIEVQGNGNKVGVTLEGPLEVPALEQQQIQHEDRSFAVTASFGVAGVTSSTDGSLEELYRRADQAVYEAKQSGRNRVCVRDPLTRRDPDPND